MRLVAILLFSCFSFSSNATLIIDQEGGEAPDGFSGVGLENTLTGGYIVDDDFQWNHTYQVSGNILSATLRMDIIDAEGTLDLYAGTDTSGIFIGSLSGVQQDGVGWLDLTGPNASIDNLITIDSSLFADLSDGSFDIFGFNNGVGAWGSNRAILTIVTDASVPAPSTVGIVLLAFASFFVSRQRA